MEVYTGLQLKKEEEVIISINIQYFKDPHLLIVNGCILPTIFDSNRYPYPVQTFNDAWILLLPHG